MITLPTLENFAKKFVPYSKGGPVIEVLPEQVSALIENDLVSNEDQIEFEDAAVLLDFLHSLVNTNKKALIDLAQAILNAYGVVDSDSLKVTDKRGETGSVAGTPVSPNTTSESGSVGNQAIRKAVNDLHTLAEKALETTHTWICDKLDRLGL